jgi:hypothetical protein
MDFACGMGLEFGLISAVQHIISNWQLIGAI